MITLCGFAVSNYYNKVKLALLEKGVPFTEEYVKTGRKDEEVLADSQLGKVPYIRTPQGPLCESQVILDYIEATHPNPPLLPADPFQAAKVRELVSFVDLHLELVRPQLYVKGGDYDIEALEETRRVRTWGGEARALPFVDGYSTTALVRRIRG